MPYALDPELAAVAAVMPTLDLADIPAARVEQLRQRARRPVPDSAGVQVSEVVGPGRPGQPDVGLRVYRPANGASGAGILDIHGGGFITGDLETSAAACLDLARELGVVVVSVDYRLAPEHPYPAALDDCLAGLDWLVAHAADLDVDPARLALHGVSAGAGLAAGLALRLRDDRLRDDRWRNDRLRNDQGPRVAFLYLAIPELDDRLDSASMTAFTDTPVWTQLKAGISWAAYLGAGRPGAADVSPYAAPARATDLRDLPPTYICVATFDPLRDEGIAFARTLLAAGVAVELHLFPGTFHGSFLIDSAVSRREIDERRAVLRRGLAI